MPKCPALLREGQGVDHCLGLRRAIHPPPARFIGTSLPSCPKDPELNELKGDHLLGAMTYGPK